MSTLRRRAGIRVIVSGLATIAALGSGHLTAQAQSAAAQEWPSRPVTIVVGYAAGGGVDFVARLLAEKLGERLRQPVVVENRPSVGEIGRAHV